jgi:hypothetical protein
MKKIFLPTYSGKTEPDSKVKGTNKYDDEKTVIQTEERIAVTTQQLADFTLEKQKKIGFSRLYCYSNYLKNIVEVRLVS